MTADARDEGRVIDVSCGRRTRAVIVTDSEHVILSAIQAETIANRLDDSADEEVEETEEGDQTSSDESSTSTRSNA